MRIDKKVKRNIMVRVQICRSSDDWFRLSIEDEASSLLIAEIKLDADAVANMISSRMSDAVPAEYYHNDNIGKKMVHKCFDVDLKLLLPMPFKSYDRDSNERDLRHVYDLAEEQNPGWKADRSSYNSKLKRGDTYEVILRKYESQE